MVLRVMPDVRGRAVCNVDSIATRVTGVFIARCDFGGGLALTIHGDTIFAVERVLALQVPDNGQPLLDYWNNYLRAEWEARLGRRPDDLGSDRAEGSRHFEAVWNDPSGIRHLVTLRRAEREPLNLKYHAIDCREKDRRKQAIACW